MMPPVFSQKGVQGMLPFLFSSQWRPSEEHHVSASSESWNSSNQ
jgi:hypothetical protein